MRAWARIFSVSWLFIVQTANAASTGDPATQSIMHSIFEPITQVLPLSFDDKAFTAQANRKKITARLKALYDHANDLNLHANRKERAFEYMAKSLRNDTRNVYHWYAAGRYEEARFTLHNLTENCIACHSSLPENHKFPSAAAFLSAVKVKSMHPLDQAHYLVMSRQFDAALTTYEAHFKEGKDAPTDIGALGSFVDYLKICAAVKGDLQRPRQLLSELIKHKNTNITARRQLQQWASTLDELESTKALSKSSLADARALLNQGRSAMDYPRDRAGLIYYLVVNAILNKYIHNHPDHGQDVGEAYYMLGITESLLGHSFLVSRAEFYFESAIRLAPAAAFAPKAYTLLEESYTYDFSGSGGLHMPSDIKILLAELQRIVTEAQ